MRRISKKQAGRINRPRRGSIVVLAAFMLVVMIGFTALAVDLGYVVTVRTDLQAAADAGALAGTGLLLEGDDVARSAADRFAQLNLNNTGVNSGRNLNIEVQIGHWDKISRSFGAGQSPTDAVKVIAKSTSAPLFFGRTAEGKQFRSQAEAVATYRPRDIMLVLDVSGSMNEARKGIRKIDELRKSVRFFLRFLRGAASTDQVGFSFYSSIAQLGSELSLDLDQVESDLMARLNAGGTTNIADGMQIAIDELENHRRANAAPLIVVLTDGAANTIQPGNAFNVPEAKARVIQKAQRAKRSNFPCFTMALDSQSSEVDIALMARVAEITGSESFHVIAGERDISGDPQLKEAFKRVALVRPLSLVD